MAALGQVSAWALAVVFVWAASAKLARPGATRKGFSDLGLPAAAVLVWGVPLAELLTAVLLLAVPGVGGVLALVLLAAFSAVVARAVGRKSTAVCTCFGRTSRRPVSASDLLRNALMAALALLAAAPSWATAALFSAAAAVWLAAGYRRGRR